jgi:hypothetical protein
MVASATSRPSAAPRLEQRLDHLQAPGTRHPGRGWGEGGGMHCSLLSQSSRRLDLNWHTNPHCAQRHEGTVSRLDEESCDGVHKAA